MLRRHLVFRTGSSFFACDLEQDLASLHAKIVSIHGSILIVG